MSEVNYGRTIKGDVCHCKEGTSIAAGNCPTDPMLSNVDNCFSLNSHLILNNTCNGKTECTIRASNGIFGDPCPGIHKYLEVYYECHEKGNTIQCSDWDLITYFHALTQHLYFHF